MKTKLSLLLLFLSFSAYSQMTFTAEEKRAMDWLQERMKDFRSASNDSIFIADNSDKPYYIIRFDSGDQAEDIDRDIFNAKPGDVVGPFRGDTFCYIFKILSYSDSMFRAKANLIHFRPKGKLETDSTELNKYLSKYVDALKKNKDVFYLAMKDEDKLSLRNNKLNWYWEYDKDKEHFEEIFSGKKGEPTIIRNSKGIFILQIVEEKARAPYKVTLVPIVRKI